MGLKGPVLAILILFFPVCALAGESLNGSLEYKFFGHFKKTRQDPQLFANEGRLRLDMKYKLKPVDIVLTPVVRADDRHFTAGVIDSLKETDERRYYVNFREAYVKAPGERSDFYLGKRVYSWGKAEGYNPTDNINPYDYLDFPDREKIGVFSASLEHSLGNSNIDIVWVPFFTPGRLPERDNRWAGTVEADTAVVGGQTIPAGQQVVVEERELPPDTLKNSQTAGRLRLTIESWDMALSYYHGFDSVPAVEERFVGPVRHLTPKYNKISVYGFSLVTTLEKLEAHVETAYRHTESGDDDDFVSYIAGGSYSWDEPLSFVEKFSLYLEYAGEEVTDEKDNPARYSAKNYTRPFKRSALGSIIARFNEDAEFALSGAYNFDEYDFFLQPKLTYKLTDSLKVKAGFDMLHGAQDTFWGKWKKNDRFFMNATWYF